MICGSEHTRFKMRTDLFQPCDSKMIVLPCHRTVRFVRRLYHHVDHATDMDFAAKVRHRMRYDRNPLFISLTDKHAVRTYAAARDVQTAPLLFVEERPDAIPFRDLPPSYLIKMNHGSGWNVLCHQDAFYLFRDGSRLVRADGSFIDRQSAEPYRLTRAQTGKLLSGWRDQRYRAREWAYQNICPKILGEEILSARDGRELKDYRLYTFDGEVRAILLDSAVMRKKGECVIFDPGWKPVKLTKYDDRLPEPLPERPESLDEMIRTAERLGKGIDFVRIDLYDTSRGVVLGEMTFYPDGGATNTPTACAVFNRWLSGQWGLNLSRFETVSTYLWSIGLTTRHAH